jgi:exo-1,4-beta-D-glucosaminidase
MQANSEEGERTMKKFPVVMAAAGLLLAVALKNTASAGEALSLKHGWRIQSSAAINAKGEAISGPEFNADGWYPTTVPKTVLAALVENGAYPDPYYGTNLKRVPGYVDGRWLRMPEDSPFYPSWWYRVEFEIPWEYKGKNLKLHLDGINYKANVWVNGKKVADQDQVIGMFRRFEFDVSDLARPGGQNCIAIETIAPGKLPDKKYVTKQLEATTGWDDHNPQPPDMNLGVWEDVFISATGPVDVKHPYVVTDLDLPSLDVAHLTVSAYLTNKTSNEINGKLKIWIQGPDWKLGFLNGTTKSKVEIDLSQVVSLIPGETKLVKFTPEEFNQLSIKDPDLWWPNPVGPQNLHYLGLEFDVEGKVSDLEVTHFGIREVTTYINDEGWRQYVVNGKKILIRGGAWMTTDMMLNLTEERYEALVRYAREANLNMLRSEGFSIRETDEFYSICDRLGVMVTQQIFGRNIPDEALAVSCIEDMMLRIRNHPSLAHFLGHDETFPTETLSRAYQDLIEKYDVRRTYQPHSGAFQVRNRWETGGTRTGTLELWTHAGPAHYYARKIDGAWGFAQSGGIGGVVASLESIKRMMPEDELWPPLHTESWSFHSVIQGGTYYNKLMKKMYKRYGEAKDIEDFVITAHVQNYESARGMYEAYARNKYSSTGITTWKYDVAWPAAITWAYVDWYLLTTGAYHGAKKACEELHVQYSYDDDSIWVLNSLYEKFKGLKVTAKVINFDMTEKWSKSTTVDVSEDGKTEAFKIEWPKGLSRSHFLFLTLDDASGERVTDNLYWLSTRPEKPGFKFYGILPVTPSSYFDHRDLRKLPPVELDVFCNPDPTLIGNERAVRVTVTNPNNDLAFFIQLAVTKGKGGMEVAPSYWSENDFSLLPGESRQVEVSFDAWDLEDKDPVVRVGGWNIVIKECY